MSTKSLVVYRQLQKILGSYYVGVPESMLYYTLEVSYEHEFRRTPDYNSLGVDGIANLVDEMDRKGMLLYCKSQEDNMTYVMCTRTLKSRQKNLMLMIQELLDEHGGSIPLIDFEVSYENKFEVQLDYHLWGFNDFDSLCKVLSLVLLSEEPESKKTHVTSARTLKTRQKALKLNVQELLDEHGGSIPLIDFEVSYKDKFKAKLDYHYYSLKDFYSLCEVLDLVVEAGNS